MGPEISNPWLARFHKSGSLNPSYSYFSIKTTWSGLKVDDIALGIYTPVSQAQASAVSSHLQSTGLTEVVRRTQKIMSSNSRSSGTSKYLDGSPNLEWSKFLLLKPPSPQCFTSLSLAFLMWPDGLHLIPPRADHAIQCLRLQKAHRLPREQWSRGVKSTWVQISAPKLPSYGNLSPFTHSKLGCPLKEVILAPLSCKNHMRMYGKHSVRT